jgi:adenylate kinase
MPTYIVLLGPPGAGKGTQAKRIAERLNIPHVSTGDLFRAMKTLDTPLAKRVQEIMARGDLVDDQTTVEIVEDRLSQPDCSERGAILDGFPRNVDQAEALKKLLADRNTGVTLALLIDVPKEVTIQRITGRARREGRKDDTPEVAERRYQVYLGETEPLVEYYDQQALLRRINGDQTIDEVTADLVKTIQQAVGAR